MTRYVLGGPKNRQAACFGHFHEKMGTNNERPSSSLQALGGRVVARILPKGVPNEYEEHNKPITARLAPSRLLGPGTGPLAYRPLRKTTSTTTGRSVVKDHSSLWTDHESKPRHDTVRRVASNGVDDDGGAGGGSDAGVRIEAYLFPLVMNPVDHSDSSSSIGNHDGHSGDDHPDDDDEYDESKTIALTLMRQSSEPAIQSLKRLELSIVKKLNKANCLGLPMDQKKKAKKNKTTKEHELSAASNSGTNNKSTVATVWVEGQQIDDWQDVLANTSNGAFWSMALSKALEIRITINGGMETIRLPVECNPPTVIGVSTFEKFQSHLFPGVPVVLEIESAHATSVVVDWYVDKQVVCNDSLCYIPNEKDANKRLCALVTPKRADHNGRGCEEAYQFSHLVSEHLPENTLVTIRPTWRAKRVQQENSESSPQAFRILSYNILADQNAFSMDNPGTPYFSWTTPELMDRARRMPLLLHEILAYQADIICLQEVDQLVYDTLLRPVLNYYDYQGYFSMKQTSGTREGCAMFFSLYKFQSSPPEDLKTFRISPLLSDIVAGRNIAPGWEGSVKPVAKLFEERNNLQETIDNLAHVVQVAKLRHKNGNPILVANTHLFFHPNADHIRVMQCFAIAHQLAIEQGDGTPFVLVGDFNTDLDDCAALLVDRRTPRNYKDCQRCLNTFRWKDDGTDYDEESNPTIDFPELFLPDSFPRVVSGHQDHPEFTHLVVEYKATIDHILLSSSTTQAELKPFRQAPLPTLAQATRYTAMPSPCFPSDHCSVLVDILFCSMRQ